LVKARAVTFQILGKNRHIPESVVEIGFWRGGRRVGLVYVETIFTCEDRLPFRVPGLSARDAKVSADMIGMGSMSCAHGLNARKAR
jgi:hypothetical protein